MDRVDDLERPTVGSTPSMSNQLVNDTFVNSRCGNAQFGNIQFVNSWKDPVVERVGFDACGEYVELFWLPVIGPTSTWLLRRLAVMSVLNPEGFALDGPSTARSLGLGSDAGPRSSLARSLHRLCLFGLARCNGSSLSIRTIVPPLSLKHLARLPDDLQRAHSVWAETDSSAAHEAAYRCTIESDSPVSVSAS